MGNSQNVDREALIQAETQVLALSGLQPHEIKAYDLSIQEGTSFVRTIEVGFPTTEV